MNEREVIEVQKDDDVMTADYAMYLAHIEWYGEKTKDGPYWAGKGRVGDKMVVYVTGGHKHYYHKEIKLQRHWFQLTSPLEKIFKSYVKAKAKAKLLNDRELYLAHEAELSEK